MKRTVFFLSDSTGMTAENVGRSLLVQFPQYEFDCITKPFIDSEEKAQKIADEIKELTADDEDRPIIVDTIVDDKISKIVRECPCFYIDIFSTFLEPLEAELKIQSAHTVGHPVIYNQENSTANEQYKQRISAVHFAMANDDGMLLDRYSEADIILIGVSRVGKTPSSIYLGMQFGINAANYPLIPDDLESARLPKALQLHKKKLFGLTIKPGRLSEIRNERKPHSTYANLKTCMSEVRIAEGMYRQYGIPYLDITQLSVEEISARILQKVGIERRVTSI